MCVCMCVFFGSEECIALRDVTLPDDIGAFPNFFVRIRTNYEE